jgi:glycosyltransferase involved in cell wall biosynthesis
MGYEENFLPAEQIKLGHEVQIVTSDRAPFGVWHSIGRFLDQRIIGSGVFEYDNVTVNRLPCRFEVINGGQVILKGLRRTLRDLKPDVVHVHGALTASALLAVWYSKELGYKVFVDDHLNYCNLQIDSAVKKVYLQLARLFYRVYGKRVSFWMPTTYASEQLLQSLLAVPRDKMEITPLGVDTTCFAKSEKSRRVGRAQIGVDADDTLIVTAGKFNKSKDIETLVKAFCKVTSETDNVYLLVLGNGPEAYMHKIRVLANKGNLGSKIIFKDFAPHHELPIYYNAADLGVWPGDPSITVIEAIATGLPVILPQHELAYGILFRNGAALGFKRGDPISLAKSVLKLVYDSNLKSKITNRSFSLVADTLAWNKIAQRSIDIYSTVQESKLA